MKRILAINLLCLSLIVLAGCLGGVPGGDTDGTVPMATTSEPESPTGTEPLQTPRPGCESEDHRQADAPECLITEQPADLRIENHDSVDHNLTLRIVRNDSTVVVDETVRINVSDTYTKTVSVLRNDSEVVQTQGEFWGVLFRDVFDAPGNYTITASLDESTSDTGTWDVGQRYFGIGNVEWIVSVTSPDEVDVRKTLGG